MKDKQRYILLKKGRGTVRCYIKRIICIVSAKGQCAVYEHRKNSKRTASKVVSSYKLSWFKEQIDDPRYFDIFEGTIYNTRFFEQLDNDRIIHSNVKGLPRLVVSKAQCSPFRKHLTQF